MDNTNEQNAKKTYTDPVTGKFVKGNPGGGRPSGSLDFKTKFENFITKLAESNKMKPEEIDEQLFAVAYKKAKEGDYQFYRDIHDRLYGKPTSPIDVTTGGKPIIQIAPEIAAKYDINTSTIKDSEE